MKLGVLVPQLRSDPAPAFRVAEVAEHEGINGVFAFDHLRWMPSGPQTPVLAPFPLLAAIAARTESLELGTLIARVDTVPIDDVVDAFRALRDVAGERVIAGLGTGDRVTIEEDRELGLSPSSYARRLEQLEGACVRLRDEGLPVWLAGGSVAVRAIADRQGAIVHRWTPEPETLSAIPGPWTWGGVLPNDPQAVTQALLPVVRARATWAVCGIEGGTDTSGALLTLRQGVARLGD